MSFAHRFSKGWRWLMLAAPLCVIGIGYLLFHERQSGPTVTDPFALAPKGHERERPQKVTQKPEILSPKRQAALSQAQSDPEGFLAYLLKNRQALAMSSDNNEALRLCFETLGPQKYQEWIASLLSTHDNSSILLSQTAITALAGYGEINPNVLAVLKSAAVTDQGVILGGFIDQVVKRDPHAAAKLLDDLDLPPLKKAVCAETVVSALMETDPAAAIKLLKSLDIKSYPVLMSGNLEKLLAFDHAGTIEMLRSLPSGTTLKALNENATSLIAKNDSAQIIDIINKIPITASTVGSYNEVVGKLILSGIPASELLDKLNVGQQPSTISLIFANAKADKADQLVELADTLGDDRLKTAAEVGITQRLAKDDISAASAFALQSKSQEVLKTLASNMVDRSGNKALALIDNPEFISTVDQQTRQQLIEKVATSWAGINKDEAIEWLKSRPQSEQPVIVKGIMKNWVTADVNGAADWLNSLPQGAARDEGVKALISEIEPTDPNAAAQWKETLTSKGK